MSEGRTVLVFSNVGGDFELLDDRRQFALPIEELRKNLQDFMVSL